VKVLHVYKLYAPLRGGGITAANAIIEELAGTVGSSVLTAVPRGRGNCNTYGNARVRRVGSLGYYNSMPMAPTFPYWFHREARKVDLVHLHMPFPLSDVALLLRYLDKLVVVHWHSDIIQQVFTRRLLQPLLEHTLRRTDRIIVATRRHIWFWLKSEGFQADLRFFTFVPVHELQFSSARVLFN
jgi:hypothetical protein